MATPLFMLALFLHPGYRVLGRNADGRDDFKVIGREAVEMLRARKRSQNEITIMLYALQKTWLCTNPSN
ncbi:hypothetical protein WJX77_005920 [Trebouxia sp. C0004]